MMLRIGILTTCVAAATFPGITSAHWYEVQDRAGDAINVVTDAAGAAARKTAEAAADAARKSAEMAGAAARKTAEAADAARRAADAAAKATADAASRAATEAAQKTAEAAKSAAGGIKDAVVDAPNKAKDVGGQVFKKGLKTAEQAYYGMSDATHTTINAVRTADEYTLQPVKHVVEDCVINPAWQTTSFVVKPVGRAAQTTIDFADAKLAMDGTMFPGVKYVDDSLGWAGNRLGIDSEVAKMLDPMRDARRVLGQVTQDAPVFLQTVATEDWSALSLDPTKTIGAVEDITMAAVAVGGNASMSAVKPVIVSYASGLMYQEPNEEIVLGEGVSEDTGRPEIFFINGIANDESSAKASARALSQRANTQIGLIWNEGDDSAGRTTLSAIEATYDRISNTVAIGPLRAFNGNSTTRRITGAIVQNAAKGKDIILVAHSQGALDTVSAMQAAASLGLGDYIRHHVKVVLVGVPFVKAEIQPKPAQVWCLQNRHDAVAGLVGGNLTNPTSVGNGHAFQSDYLPSIDPAWLR